MVAMLGKIVSSNSPDGALRKKGEALRKKGEALRKKGEALRKKGEALRKETVQGRGACLVSRVRI